MNAHIRRAVLADAEPACDLVRRSITELCVADHRGDDATLTAWLANKTVANFAAWISSPQHVAIVAASLGTMVGFALLNRSGAIALLYVAPECRFSDVSKTMLAALEEEAAALDIAEIKLDSSVTALSFYKRCGYVQTGDAVPGFGVTLAYPLCKRIAS